MTGGSDVALIERPDEASGSKHTKHTPGQKLNDAKRRLLQAACVCAVFMLIEIAAGLYAGSLAILTDAAHMLSDLSSFLISLFAMQMSTRPGTVMLSFGYQRAEILGALVSVLLIWIITLSLLYSAFERLLYPHQVQGNIMVYTSLFGIASNVAIAMLLSDGHHHHHHGHSHGHNHGAPHVDCHDHVEGLQAGYTEESLLQSGSHLAYGGAPSDTDSVTPPPHGTAVNNYRACGEMLKRLSLSTQEALPVPPPSDIYISVEDDASADGRQYQVLYTKESHEPESGNCVSSNVNIAAAYIHALGDLVQNIGVLIAGAIIWVNPSWTAADPICTIVFGFIVFYTTLGLLKDVRFCKHVAAAVVFQTTNVLMEGTPAAVNVPALIHELGSIPGVV